MPKMCVIEHFAVFLWNSKLMVQNANGSIKAFVWLWYKPFSLYEMPNVPWIFRNGNFCNTMPLGKVESFEMQCNFVVSFKTWNEIAGSSSVSCKATAFKT